MDAPSAASNHVQWEALVGRALLRFGDIEYVSIRCLQVIPSDRIATSISKMDFSRRAEVLIEILENRQNLTQALGKLLEGFKRAKVLAKRRNLIAHNPLMLSLYFNTDTQESSLSLRIDSARSERHSITLDELKAFAAEVEDLAAGMWIELGNVAGESGQVWKEFAYLDD